jgi:hypothetical protein
MGRRFKEMKKLMNSLISKPIPLLIMVSFFCMPVQAKYGGGTGQANDPYLIFTAEQMSTIGAEPADWNKHFKLMADLDLAGLRVNPIGYWTQSSGENNMPFTGVFDGNGRSIINFKYTPPDRVDERPVTDSVGLFAYISGNEAEVKNLKIIDPRIEDSSYSGLLVGRIDRGIVRDCSVVGGFIDAGMNSYVGGLVGYVNSGVVERCSSSADVTGLRYIGGLVGFCERNTNITCCSATGIVLGIEPCVGGLVGSSRDCSIGGSFASGEVLGGVSSSEDAVGGLVGRFADSRCICCYATGNVTGGNSVGGLFGLMTNAYILDSYAAGRINARGENVGGFTGQNLDSLVYGCFWNTESSKISVDPIGTGLTSAEMHDMNNFINAGWDFAGESANGPSDIWIMPDEGGYPILTWQVSPLPDPSAFSSGTGEPNDPFIISTVQQLNSIGNNPGYMSAHFRLANDIDLAGTDLFLIGHEGFPFEGVFDGNDYAIRNFTHSIMQKNINNVGLFRYVRNLKAEIKNLVLADSSIVNDVNIVEGNYFENIGSLIGVLYDGTVFNCHVENGEVIVASANGVGGLIGINEYGDISRCDSTVTVSGENAVGGLVGSNFSLIETCRSSGEVLSNFSGSRTGGISGSNYGYMIHCISSCNVSGDNRDIGGLTGDNWGWIRSCKSSGSVSGSWEVGGLVGGWNTGLIWESCSYSTVVGRKYVGGLVGNNIHEIHNSYARGSVSGVEMVGGLVGNNDFLSNVSGSCLITTSYSTGVVTGTQNTGGLVGYTANEFAITSNNCFWDVQTSGLTTSDGGTAKTTMEMQAAGTFLDAEWDFVNESNNGTNDIWLIDEGRDYPKLLWELYE